MIDVVVIGGGPAGLSAALMLGRCRRSVVVCDDGTPRNRASLALHGFLSRDGIAPGELLEIARDELAPYGVEYRRVRVKDVRRLRNRFDVRLSRGDALACRKLLIATGVEDNYPRVEGFSECYGISVFHCPYCDGWEWRDRSLAVYGRGRAGAALALSLRTWSEDVGLICDGPAHLRADTRKTLRRQGIRVIEDRVTRLVHEDGHLRAIECLHERIGRDVLFFTTGQHQQAAFAGTLGCEFTPKGTVRTDRHGQTCVPGVFVVGDASFDVQFVAVAAAEGAKAAVAINRQFQSEAGQELPPPRI
jgi:thioredoxin reductase